VKAGDAVEVAVVVENTGAKAGEEVVQLYMKASGVSGPRPNRWLAGFERVPVRAGEKKTVHFTLSARQFSAAQAGGRRLVEPGRFEVSVGGGQTGGVTGSIQVQGPGKELN
jgi:beta-glucosidase